MAESRKKMIAAFVERVTKRLQQNPRAPLSSRHRMAFIAVRDLIEAAMESGGTMKATWETLREDGKLSMSYETFRAHCRELGLGRRRRSKRATPATASGAAAPRSAASRRATAGRVMPPADGPREFRHDPVPRLDKIYG